MRADGRDSVRTRIAIDAGNLVRDRRGIGRLGRAAISIFSADPALEITLIANRRDRPALRDEFPNARIASTATARRSDRYDVSWYPFNGIRFTSAAPAVVTIHDAFAFTQPHREFVARYREQAPIRRAARRATRLVTTTAWCRAEIARELRIDPSAIAIVSPTPDGFFTPARADRISTWVFASDGDALPASLGDGPFALVVGAGEARKNARLALDACARALRSPHESLAIVGTLGEADRAHARSLDLRFAELSADDALLRALYRRARVVLIPSLAEGFGLVAAEALACGAAVIAARAGALPETTRGAAMLLDPSDPDAWALAIRSVFDDGDVAEELRRGALAAFGNDDRAAYGRAMAALLVETARASGIVPRSRVGGRSRP